MELLRLYKKDLENFIHSPTFNSLRNLPISKLRAVSHIHNPRAGDTDLLLVAAFDGDKTIGYLGVLPDYLFDATNRCTKVAWFSCFWVDNGYKEQKLSEKLFQEIVSAWGNNLLITNSVPWMENYYQRTGIFKPTLVSSGTRAYLRLNLSDILPPKKVFFGKIVPLLKLIDAGFNFFNDFRVQFSAKKIANSLTIHKITELGVADKLFISEYNKSANKRNIEEVHWILAHPWMHQSEQKSGEDSKYYFSTHSQRFENRLYRFEDNTKCLQGILFIHIRDSRLAVPYIFGSKEFKLEVLKFIKKTMAKDKISMFTTFDIELAAILDAHPDLFLATKKVKKMFFVSKNFQAIDVSTFQDGDGDCVFC